MLRERCLSGRRTDWITEGVELLDQWLCSDQNLAGADQVVDLDGRSAGGDAHTFTAAITRPEPGAT